MRFPMSVRWTVYIAPSHQGGSKTQRVYIAPSHQGGGVKNTKCPKCKQ